MKFIFHFLFLSYECNNKASNVIYRILNDRDNLDHKNLENFVLYSVMEIASPTRGER